MILNLKGHPNRITGSKVTAILMNGRILPNGEATAVEGLRSPGLPRLVLIGFTLFLVSSSSVAITGIPQPSKWTPI